MPSITFDPKRLPNRGEARHLAAQSRWRAQHHPDGDEGDYLTAYVLEAFARGDLVPFAPSASDGKPPRTR